MKYSRQREAILQVIQDHPVHPTADMVYALVKPIEPNISLATVYRNLKLLTEQGMLKKISVPQDSDRFDACTEHHHHFFCTHCHQLFDVQQQYADVQIQIHEKSQNIQITGYQLFIDGVCESCMQKINQKEV